MEEIRLDLDKYVDVVTARKVMHLIGEGGSSFIRFEDTNSDVIIDYDGDDNSFINKVFDYMMDKHSGHTDKVHDIRGKQIDDYLWKVFWLIGLFSNLKRGRADISCCFLTIKIGSYHCEDKPVIDPIGDDKYIVYGPWGPFVISKNEIQKLS